MSLYLFSVAPSPPRSVRARLVSAQQSLIEVSWREPAATNGIITQYMLSVTSSGRGSTNDGNDVNQGEAFNRASAKFCAIRYYLYQTPQNAKIKYHQMLIYRQ